MSDPNPYRPASDQGFGQQTSETPRGEHRTVKAAFVVFIGMLTGYLFVMFILKAVRLLSNST